MRKIKQAVSLILVFCIGIYLYPAKKSSAMETIGFNDQEYWSRRMEDVRVEGIFDFSEEAIAAIEDYVVADEKGLFYVEDEVSLRLVLTDNEYDLVLKQIEIINKEVASEPIRAALGTEGNPYILTEGTPLPVSVSGAAKTWLKISNIRGATEFTVMANRQVTVTIYRKNLIGKTQVSIGGGEYSKQIVSSSAINNNSRNYLIEVTAPSTCRFSVTVWQYRDVTFTYYQGGTVWTPLSGSAIPWTEQLVQERWYLKAEDIPHLVNFVTHNAYLELCEKYANGLITVTGIAALFINFGNGVEAVICEKIIGGALTLIGGLGALNFKQAVLNRINEAGGWDAAQDRYTQNIYMEKIFFTNLAVTQFYVYTWSGTAISGSPGYTGSFSRRK